MDARALDEIQGTRQSTKASESVEYGDDQVSPPKLKILRARLEQDIGDKLTNQTVTVQKFKVWVTRYAPNLAGKGPVHVPSSGSVGGDILAGLLAGLLIHSIEDARTPRSIGVEISIDIDGRKFEVESRDSSSRSNLEKQIPLVIAKALDELVDKIAKPALPPDKVPASESGQEAAVNPEAAPAGLVVPAQPGEPVKANP